MCQNYMGGTKYCSNHKKHWRESCAVKSFLRNRWSKVPAFLTFMLIARQPKDKELLHVILDWPDLFYDIVYKHNDQISYLI